jgi:hypothetical protein
MDKDLVKKFEEEKNLKNYLFWSGIFSKKIGKLLINEENGYADGHHYELHSGRVSMAYSINNGEWILINALNIELSKGRPFNLDEDIMVKVTQLLNQIVLAFSHSRELLKERGLSKDEIAWKINILSYKDLVTWNEKIDQFDTHDQERRKMRLKTIDWIEKLCLCEDCFKKNIQSYGRELIDAWLGAILIFLTDMIENKKGLIMDYINPTDLFKWVRVIPQQLVRELNITEADAFKGMINFILAKH